MTVTAVWGLTVDRGPSPHLRGTIDPDRPNRDRPGFIEYTFTLPLLDPVVLRRIRRGKAGGERRPTRPTGPDPDRARGAVEAPRIRDAEPRFSAAGAGAAPPPAKRTVTTNRSVQGKKRQHSMIHLTSYHGLA